MASLHLWKTVLLVSVNTISGISIIWQAALASPAAIWARESKMSWSSWSAWMAAWPCNCWKYQSIFLFSSSQDNRSSSSCLAAVLKVLKVTSGSNQALSTTLSQSPSLIWPGPILASLTGAKAVASHKGILNWPTMISRGLWSFAADVTSPPSMKHPQRPYSHRSIQIPQALPLLPDSLLFQTVPAAAPAAECFWTPACCLRRLQEPLKKGCPGGQASLKYSQSICYFLAVQI